MSFIYYKFFADGKESDDKPLKEKECTIIIEFTNGIKLLEQVDKYKDKDKVDEVISIGKIPCKIKNKSGYVTHINLKTKKIIVNNKQYDYSKMCIAIPKKKK